jgi:hypothetical protein
MKICKIMAVALAGCLAGFLASTNAQTLNLGGGIVEGSLTNQELVGAFTGDNDGSISTWVVNDSTLDPNGYLFIYQVVNDGPDAVANVSLDGYNSGEILSTGTYSNVINLTLATSLSTSLDGNFPNFSLIGGNAATFQTASGSGGFSNSIPNNVSYFLVVYTDKTFMAETNGFDEDDFAAQGNILSPVPEPGTPALAAVGLISFLSVSGMAWVRGFRKRQ